ncbi:MAG: tetratricopeptide repeat protein [Ignavibacteriae bacterium]|nr:MAG: tetratricopeptide repeat protein [Ignavibacteriota bacterium]
MRPIQDVEADVIAAADAVDEQSLALLRKELQDRDTPEALALTARIQGFTSAFAGAYEEARTSFEAALAFYEGASRFTDIAYVTSNLGRVHVLRGDATLGLEWFKKSLALFEDLGDRSGSARVLHNLGTVYSALGSHGDAVMWFTRALAAYKDLDDRRKIADSHLNIGINYEYSSSYPEALDHLDKALALYEELGDRSLATSVWSNIGTVHHLMGYHTVAFEF